MLPEGRGEYFERLYAADSDPWGFDTSWYEQRKYEVTTAALPRRRYRSAFEPGCSIGVLTSMLAQRCDQVLAIDMVESAVRQAAARLADQPHVTVQRRALADGWPAGTFDLVVLSEIAYYFEPDALDDLVTAAIASMGAGGTLLAVHWRGETDYALSGDQTHQRIDDAPALAGVAHYEEEKFLLDVWEVTL
jgi:SAM-dependent methyltransferase